MRAQRTRPCSQCGDSYSPRTTLQAVCGLECALKQSRAKQKEREERDQAHMAKVRKEMSSQKRRSKAVENAEAQVNRFIRCRDYGMPCISCGKYKSLTAGHHKSVAANPEMRFNTKNINGQCSFCNLGHVRKYQDGTVSERYDLGVLHRFGQGRLDYLNSPHPAKKYSLEQLNRIRRIFKRRADHYARLRGIGK